MAVSQLSFGAGKHYGHGRFGGVDLSGSDSAYTLGAGLITWLLLSGVGDLLAVTEPVNDSNVRGLRGMLVETLIGRSKEGE